MIAMIGTSDRLCWLAEACKILLLFGTNNYVPLIDWISDTRSQGCIDLQSLVKCLDHRGIVLVLDTVYACSQARVVLGCAMH